MRCPHDVESAEECFICTPMVQQSLSLEEFLAKCTPKRSDRYWTSRIYKLIALVRELKKQRDEWAEYVSSIEDDDVSGEALLSKGNHKVLKIINGSGE